MAPWGALAYVAAAGATVVGIAASPALVPAAVGAAGFGSGGIAAGSLAAGFMSTYAGAVPAGSVCAILQSVGAAGLSTSTIVGTEAVAAGLAGAFTALGGHIFKKPRPPASARDEENSETSEDEDNKKPPGDEENSGNGEDEDNTTPLGDEDGEVKLH